MTEYEPKRCFGFVPLLPLYPVGARLRLLVEETVRIAKGKSGRRYMRQDSQARGFGRRLLSVALQFPGALLRAVVDETSNVWRSRHNRRVKQNHAA